MGESTKNDRGELDAELVSVLAALAKSDKDVLQLLPRMSRRDRDLLTVASEVLDGDKERVLEVAPILASSHEYVRDQLQKLKQSDTDVLQLLMRLAEKPELLEELAGAAKSELESSGKADVVPDRLRRQRLVERALEVLAKSDTDVLQATHVHRNALAILAEFLNKNRDLLILLISLTKFLAAFCVLKNDEQFFLNLEKISEDDRASLLSLISLAENDLETLGALVKVASIDINQRLAIA